MKKKAESKWEEMLMVVDGRRGVCRCCGIFWNSEAEEKKEEVPVGRKEKIVTGQWYSACRAVPAIKRQ